MKRARRDAEPGRRWLAFLRNHREATAAMDFFTVPTFSFSLLYCFFVISHDRRRVLPFNVTCHPTSVWIVQQLREAFPYQAAPRFLIFDHDAKYGVGSSRGDSIHEDCLPSNLHPEPMAKRSCGTLGWQLPT
jgi:hypothetical protein